MARDLPKEYQAIVVWPSNAKARLEYRMPSATYTLFLAPLDEYWTQAQPSFFEGDLTAWKAMDDLVEPPVRKQLVGMIQGEVGKAVLATWDDVRRESVPAGTPTLRLR